MRRRAMMAVVVLVGVPAALAALALADHSCGLPIPQASPYLPRSVFVGLHVCVPFGGPVVEDGAYVAGDRPIIASPLEVPVYHGYTVEMLHHNFVPGVVADRRHTEATVGWGAAGLGTSGIAGAVLTLTSEDHALPLGASLGAAGDTRSVRAAAAGGLMENATGTRVLTGSDAVLLTATPQRPAGRINGTAVLEGPEASAQADPEASLTAGTVVVRAFPTVDSEPVDGGLALRTVGERWNHDGSITTVAGSVDAHSGGPMPAFAYACYRGAVEQCVFPPVVG